MLIGVICAMGAALAAVGIAVTQLRRARSAEERLALVDRTLAETSSQLDSLLDNLPAAVVFADVDGVYRRANPVYCHWAGLSSDEIVGRTAREIFPDETASRLEALNREALTTKGVAKEEIELPVAGQLSVRSLSKFPTFDDDGTVVGLWSVSTDLTEQREAEHRLEHAQRMETVGKLSGGMAHDFNNLLMVVRGNLDLLREEFTGDDHPAAAKIERALKGVDRGAEIIHRLLSFARQQNLAPLPVRVDKLLEQTKALIERTLRENIELKIDVARDLPPILVDPAQFESALINLALNAQDAMVDGGVLRFTAEVDGGPEGAQRLVIRRLDCAPQLLVQTAHAISSSRELKQSPRTTL